MHFTRHSTFEDRSDGGLATPSRSSPAARAPTSGTTAASEYLDGLAGLFVVQVGHGREELAEAAAKQARELAFFPLWSYAHPAAIELAERLAAVRARATSTASSSPPAAARPSRRAWKLAKQYFKLIGKPTKHKVISRAVAYHGTPQGALSITGIPAAKEMFEPLVPGALQGAQHQPLPRARAPARRPQGLRPAGPPTGSPRRSSSRAPTPWPRSSSSRCRTPAAASRRRPATSSGSARSATSTTCCWSPTRSSARSAGSATCSPATTSATCPTSSPAPRA